MQNKVTINTVTYENQEGFLPESFMGCLKGFHTCIEKLKKEFVDVKAKWRQRVDTAD